MPRRAPLMYRRLAANSDVLRRDRRISSALESSDSAWVALFAMSVSEENAGGGRVVTAPTNGSAGIIPAVLEYYWHFVESADDEGVRTFLLTAGAVGYLFKRNASISGAEVGCQGEVGVACSMAAAGLAAVMGAKIQGCTTIALVEPVEARRQIALDLGATHVIDPKAGPVTEALRAIIADGFDFAFDTSGRVDAIEAALGALASRGMIGLVGVPPKAEDAVAINIAAMITFGQRVVGIMEGDSDPQTFIPQLIAAHRDGRFPFDRLVQTFPLAQINDAIAAQARGECIKVVLIP